MHETRAMVVGRVTAAHFPAPRLPVLVRARWHGPPVHVAAGVATPVAPERSGD
jgi:hypothetical protein